MGAASSMGCGTPDAAASAAACAALRAAPGCTALLPSGSSSLPLPQRTPHLQGTHSHCHGGTTKRQILTATPDKQASITCGHLSAAGTL